MINAIAEIVNTFIEKIYAIPKIFVDKWRALVYNLLTEGVKKMTIEEQLKSEILKKYKSVRAFTTTINVPYSTLDSVFKRGISNAGVSTMIRVFDALDLDLESVQSGELRHRIPDIKNSPSTAEAAPGEILQQEIIRLAGNLSAEQKDLFLALLRLTAARNQGLSAADLVSAGEAALKSERQNPTR